MLFYTYTSYAAFCMHLLWLMIEKGYLILCYFQITGVLCFSVEEGEKASGKALKFEKEGA
jgi:hypothetical protein